MIRSQRFYHYLFSYILITVLLLSIMSSVIYSSFLNTLRNEVEQSTIASLDQFRDAVDLRMQELDRMAMQISANPLLTPFMVTEDGYGPYKAVAELKQYLSTNLFIHDIVIRFNAREPEQMYGASGTYGIDLFFEDIYGYRNWSKADFLQTSASLQSPVIRPLEPVRFNRFTDERFATYIAPLPAGSDTPYGIVLFLIAENAFRSLAMNVLGDYDGLLYVLDERFGLLYEYRKGESQETSERMLEQIRGQEPDWRIGSFDVQDRKFTAVRLPSGSRDRSYVAVMPEGQIMRKVDETRVLFNATVISVFVLGVILAVGFSIRHYKPLQRLAGIVSSEHQGAIAALGKPRDELAFISSAITQMARENEGLLHRLRSQAGALREQALLSLIKGKLKTREEWDDMLSFSNLRLDRPHFAVMLFLIDDYGGFRRDNSESMQELLKYSLIKVLEELSVEAGSGYGIELIDGRGIAFLLNLNEGFDDPAVLREIAEKAKQAFLQFRFTVTAGIGGICSDITAISQSYVEASHAARHRFVRGGNQIIFFHDIEPVKPGERWYPVEHVEQLVKAIKQGNSCELGETVREAFRHIVEMNVPIEAAESICFDIVNNIVKTLIELDIEIDEDLGETMERLFVPRFETIEELEQAVTEICSNVCRYIADQKESKNVLMLGRMMAFIEAHYTDHSISLEVIAEQFGLSPSYATRFFKDQTGNPLMRHIDALRMRRAKHLLKTTKLNLKEIMMEVGYLDSTNFIRKFKKIEGVTPIQYRNLTNAGG
ncbi:helix-turn-helix domain-containing protein [Paenibacillus mendelii]|uniref:Helix-turn-helix domain-containing protein n=1 Tax=Paenibacillus mendelii TaxID=206163 RepID=A0ABV6J6H7_9BACL|nr:helix-turn-helix domain-containing protein [Paenibacillus mendelii]MCQ6561140.1 helix-turn-helix domain-containing protein [Paenibacillus mendelii]